MKWIVLCAVLHLSLPDQAAAALAWTEGAGFRSAEVRPEKTGRPGFTLMNPPTRFKATRR
jgi:hypothetical protein